MLRHACYLSILSLAACKPPASEDYATRPAATDERTSPSVPVDSPDTEGAAWATSETSGRLLYGKPGHSPLLSLACEEGTLVYTRYVAADPDAKAVLALIGNGHVERFWIDAERDGDRWLWRGRLAADDQRLEVLTGPRQVEATVPGAGSVTLNPSRTPGEFIANCAAELIPPPVPPEDPA